MISTLWTYNLPSLSIGTCTSFSISISQKLQLSMSILQGLEPQYINAACMSLWHCVGSCWGAYIKRKYFVPTWSPYHTIREPVLTVAVIESVKLLPVCLSKPAIFNTLPCCCFWERSPIIFNLLVQVPLVQVTPYFVYAFSKNLWIPTDIVCVP